jgi:hypothetical protein
LSQHRAADPLQKDKLGWIFKSANSLLWMASITNRLPASQALCLAFNRKRGGKSLQSMHGWPNKIPAGMAVRAVSVGEGIGLLENGVGMHPA